jgi:aminoglycoside 6'-N-acetyltransferase I
MSVRPAARTDADAWYEMRCALWPNSDHDHRTEVAAYFERPSDVTVCLVAEAPDEGLVGFAEVGTRPYAEGCLTSPVGYLEGIFVRPLHRDSGVGRSLVETAEAWARELGCIEMASDRLLNNEPSGAFHESLGYGEVERIVCYRKSLGPVEVGA